MAEGSALFLDMGRIACPEDPTETMVPLPAGSIYLVCQLILEGPKTCRLNDVTDELGDTDCCSDGGRSDFALDLVLSLSYPCFPIMEVCPLCTYQ